MRLTEVLHRSQRKKANELRAQFKKSIGDYRFMQVPVLRDTVTSSASRKKEMPCPQPFAILMQCWKDSNFEEGLCLKEKNSFEECMQRFETGRKLAKEQGQKDTLGGDWKERHRLSKPQANLLLKQYPRPPYEINITHNYGKPFIKPLIFKESENKTLGNSYHKKLWRRD